MAKRLIKPKSVHPTNNYTHGVLTSGGLLFISGQVAKNKKDKTVGLADITAQAEQVFENIGAILKEAGGSFRDLVKLNIYLTDGRHLEGFREVRKRYLKNTDWASTGVVVAGLASPEWLLEIEGVADLGGR